MVFQLSSRSLNVENTTLRPRDDEFSFQSDGAFSSSESSTIGIPDILGALRRRWRFPVLGSLTGLMLAVSYIILATPLYTSTASILIDTRMNQNLQAQKIVEDAPLDTSVVDSQVQIFSSESIILPVIKSMNLTHDSEFVGPPDAIGAKVLWQIKELMNGVKHSLGLNDDRTIDPDAFLERTAVETFLKRLTPKREDLTYVIDIGFASEDPNKAARVANAIADAYISACLEAKYTSTKLASQWLQDRLVELKDQATGADRALQNYKSTNNIVDTGRGLLNQQQLSDLDTQLISVRTETAQAKARLDRIRQISSDGIPDATVTDSLNNSVITRLRAQYLDTAARAADLTSRVGQKHIAVVRLNEQMDELRHSIRGEERRIADAYTSDYEIAKAREKSLTDSMDQLVGEAGTSGQAQVMMRDLESSADTYRNLYNSFLQKFQETIQTQTIPVTDTRVVTRATPPLYKSAPKGMLALAGGMVLGFFIGASVAIARETLVDAFRTPNEVEQTTGVPCLGILPNITNRRRTKWTQWFYHSANSRRKELDSTEGIEEYVLKAPHSRFTETLRHLQVSINAAQLVRDVKVVGIVSSVAKEGKTTVAANLGALLVASSGARTLIIDGDLHHRTLTSLLVPNAREGLIEAIRDPSRLATLVHHRQRSRLDILPCVLEDRLPNAAGLLGSHQMEDLLLAARKAYDYIIIEIAPIVPVVDVKMVEPFIDCFVFVVEWGRSKRSLVLEALSNAEIIRDRLTGIVLNKADPVSMRSIEAYKGSMFRSHYVE
jgi:succinoglycan biosynthesis transport protein ExoP